MPNILKIPTNPRSLRERLAVVAFTNPKFCEYAALVQVSSSEIKLDSSMAQDLDRGYQIGELILRNNPDISNDPKKLFEVFKKIGITDPNLVAFLILICNQGIREFPTTNTEPCQIINELSFQCVDHHSDQFDPWQILPPSPEEAGNGILGKIAFQTSQQLRNYALNPIEPAKLGNVTLHQTFSVKGTLEDRNSFTIIPSENFISYDLDQYSTLNKSLQEGLVLLLAASGEDDKIELSLDTSDPENVKKFMANAIKAIGEAKLLPTGAVINFLLNHINKYEPALFVDLYEAIFNAALHRPTKVSQNALRFLDSHKDLYIEKMRELHYSSNPQGFASFKNRYEKYKGRIHTNREHPLTEDKINDLYNRVFSKKGFSAADLNSDDKETLLRLLSPIIQFRNGELMYKKDCSPSTIYPDNPKARFLATYAISVDSYKISNDLLVNYLPIRRGKISEPLNLLAALVINKKVSLRECYDMAPKDSKNWVRRVTRFAIAPINYKQAHIQQEFGAILKEAQPSADEIQSPRPGMHADVVDEIHAIGSRTARRDFWQSVVQGVADAVASTLNFVFKVKTERYLEMQKAENIQKDPVLKETFSSIDRIRNALAPNESSRERTSSQSSVDGAIDAFHNTRDALEQFAQSQSDKINTATPGSPPLPTASLPASAGYQPPTMPTAYDESPRPQA